MTAARERLPRPDRSRPRGVAALWYRARVPKRFLLFVLLCLAASCGHQRPYKLGQGPTPQALVQNTAPQLSAITVGDANITLNRIIRGELAMLAQSPGRLRASVGRVGNEIMTLAFTEEGYSLRYLYDQIPSGFYSGPPDPCAVEAVLGVPFRYEGLVALVLGGAPVLQEPYETLTQGWDRKGGYEKLVIANDRFVQELQFTLETGAWRFSGAILWERVAGEQGRRLWSLEHDRFSKVGPAVLPGRTRVRAPVPGKPNKKDQLITIVYKDRDTAPAWAKSADPATSDGGGHTDGAPTSDGPSSDEWGDDEGGWENDEGGEAGSDDGWETSGGEGESSPTPPAESPAAAPDNLAHVRRDQTVADGARVHLARQLVASPRVFGKTVAQANPAGQPVGPIPSVFRIEAGGLTHRGDLCRR